MENSKIYIYLNEKEEIDDFISFKVRKITDNFEEINIVETYIINNRQNIGEANIFNGDDINLSATLLSQYINEDYNENNLFTIISESFENRISISLNQPLWIIEDFQSSDNFTSDIQNTECDFHQIIIQNQQASNDFNNKFKTFYFINNLIGVVKINNNIFSQNLNQNNLQIELNRGEYYNFEFISQDGFCNEFYPNNNSIFIPKLNLDSFKFLSYYQGSNIVTRIVYSGEQSIIFNLQFEYSIDNINWQQSNEFIFQSEVERTYYIKDNLGGTLSYIYINDGYDNVNRKPFIFFSESLSLSFKKLEELNCYNKNDYNTFSNESLNGIVYNEFQKFYNKDSITLQFKSNYRRNKFFINNENNQSWEFNVDKVSKNLNLFNSYDCKCLKYSENESIIYFESGNEYSQYGNIISQHNFNGLLPDFAIKNNIIFLDDINYIIKDFFYNEDLNKNVILINRSTNNENEELKICKAFYDLLDYEIYQFNISFELLQNGLYELKYSGKDISNNQCEYLSDNFEIIDYCDNNVAIYYYNNNNKDIFYSYNIRNFIRLELNNIYKYIDNDNDTQSNDDSIQVISSNVYDGNTFVFEEINKDLSLKIINALSSENLFINNIGYIKKGSIDLSKIENTNLSNLECNLIKNGKIYEKLNLQNQIPQFNEIQVFESITVDNTNITVDNTNITVDRI